jgi:hypothetical protein
VTLRLVSDIESPDNTNVPAMLRQYAKEIEAGEFGDVTMGVLLLESGDVLHLGEEFSAYEVMGLFEAAKLQTFADTVIEDD